MAAYVEHEFSKGFMLDEERIRKINDIICTRGKEILPEFQPNYEIYRADSFKYTTKDIQDIFREENSEWQKIQRITVRINHDKLFNLELDFDNDGKTRLLIDGEDRDKVFILFSELRQYVSNEICIIKFANGFNTSFFLNLVFVGYFISLGSVLFTEFFQIKTDPLFDQALASQDILVKLNFLVSKSNPSLQFIKLQNFSIQAIFMFVLLLIFTASSLSKLNLRI